MYTRVGKCRQAAILVLPVLALFCMGFCLRSEKQVVLDLDGKNIKTSTRAVTVREVLKENSIDWRKEDYLEPLPDRLLKPEDIIVLRKCVPVEIECDGRLIVLEQYSLDAEEVIKTAGITLGPRDRIDGIINKNELPVRISVVRIEESVVEEEEKIPYKTVQVLDPELKRGIVENLQKGEDGLVLKKYLVHYENGIETERRVIDSVVVKEALPEINAVGAKNTILLTSRSLIQPEKILELEATAYTHTGNVTFTGVYPQVGTIAVDPKVIPLGTRMWVEGYGYGIAQDTGGLIRGNIIDLFMDTERECWRWGRRKVRVYLFQ